MTYPKLTVTITQEEHLLYFIRTARHSMTKPPGNQQDRTY